MRVLKTPGAPLALLAALAALLAAWFLPLPQIMSGEEQLAPLRIPEIAERAELSMKAFDEAKSTYRRHISTNDMGALLASMKQALADAKADPSNPQPLEKVRFHASEIVAYTGVLRRYAEASERLFIDLRVYDDELMKWTRAIRASGESLRDETWPMVEVLKLYPRPVGLVQDPPAVSAADVATQTAALQADVAALQANGGPNRAALDRIEADVAAIWESGRSIEYVGGYHPTYYDALREYHSKLEEAVAAAGKRPRSTLRQVLANGLNLLLGAVTLAGLAALFMPRTRRWG